MEFRNITLATLALSCLAMGTAQAKQDISDEDWWPFQERYEIDDVLDSGSSEVVEVKDKEGKQTAMDLDYDSHILRLVLGPEGLPCEVEIEGTVWLPTKEGKKPKQEGTLWGLFGSCPTFQPLPDALANNIFGIPAGTIMPGWVGDVEYYLQKGDLITLEVAFIFPTDPTNPYSPLGVLSTAMVTDGTGKYDDVGGFIFTPDGYDGKGSLLGYLTDLD